MNMTPGWVGPLDPGEPDLNVGYEDGSVVNCTTHDRGDCRYHAPPPKAPAQGMTDEEKLAALETYLKVLDPMSKTLRAKVTEDMGKRHAEKVGAYLPDGTKLASVSRSGGRKSAKLVDPAAALRWCLHNYPDEIVRAINPAFLKKLLDANASGQVGEPGVDPATGEILPFIEVQQGNPYVTVTTTDEGKERMAVLAGGFAAMLEGAPKPGPGQGAQYDPGFADRLENGAYR